MALIGRPSRARGVGEERARGTAVHWRTQCSSCPLSTGLRVGIPSEPVCAARAAPHHRNRTRCRCES